VRPLPAPGAQLAADVTTRYLQRDQLGSPDDSILSGRQVAHGSKDVVGDRG
jgi:hypothetical protein